MHTVGPGTVLGGCGWSEAPPGERGRSPCAGNPNRNGERPLREQGAFTGSVELTMAYLNPVNTYPQSSAPGTTTADGRIRACAASTFRIAAQQEAGQDTDSSASTRS